jgi:glutamine amidotransferase
MLKNRTKVGLIDYGLGNIASIKSALQKINAETFMVSSTDDAKGCSHFILPGVGSMKVAFEEIKNKEIDKVINSIVEDQLPILGICLGMQLLSSKGFEPSETPGLDIINGEVRRIDSKQIAGKLPRLGWLNLESSPQITESKLMLNISIQRFYFAHSFHFIPTDLSAVKFFDEQGLVALIEEKNVFGTQFHPEKSGPQGLSLLQNFLDISVVH